MINQFLMEKRCCSRLEKYVSDRVWSEPYVELRTNTRPRILNAMKKVDRTVDGATVTEYIYTTAAGVLTGTGEQVTLPSSSPYYVYSIELNQFRSIKVNALEWVSLEEYCTGSRTDIKLYSDEGCVLWRAGIFMKQAKDASSVLLAVDANMLHRCMDDYIVNDDGRLTVSKVADPSRVLFTKYVESDYEPDDIIKCVKFDQYSLNQLKSGKSEFPVKPDGASMIFYRNGRVLNSLSYNEIRAGDYVECVIDKDVISDFIVHRSTDMVYHVNAGDLKGRLLVHIEKNRNPKRLLLTYNCCDVFVIPKTLTEIAERGDRTVRSSGAYVHLSQRADSFHQLTHNDFSINLKLLDEIAAKAGAANDDYYIRVIARNYVKKNSEEQKLIDKHVKDKELEYASFGAVRDANYCDLLYAESQSDDRIIHLLLDDDPTLLKYGMYFWTATYLEKNSMYAKAMLMRVGPTTPNDDHDGFYSAPVEKEFLPGKNYYNIRPKDKKEVISDTPEDVNPMPIVQGKTEVPAISLKQDLGECVASISMGIESQIVPSQAGTRIPEGTLEFKVFPGKQVTPGTQCRNCGLYAACANGGRRSTVEGGSGFVEYLCPDFSHRKISDYADILGYYHTLSLICKRVTTFYIRELADDAIKHLKIDGKIPYKGIEVTHASPEYESMKNLVAVHVPLALYDLPDEEFYPMVYINGIKLDNSKVSIIGRIDHDIPGMVEKHWTYTPSFGEDSLWEEEQRRLLIRIDDDLKVGDYIAVEILPNPKYKLTTDTSPVANKKYFILVDGEYVEAQVAEFEEGVEYYEEYVVLDASNHMFDLDEFDDGEADGVANYAFRPIGSAADEMKFLNTELIYLNGKQLVPGIDYTGFEQYGVMSGKSVTPIIQNVQYLANFDVNSDKHNHVNFTSTTDVTIGSAKGFVVGNWIAWDGVSPFWFDNLSLLTVGGRVCSNFSFKYSGIDISGETYQNGEPFMIRTLVPEMVIDILSTDESLAAREADIDRYSKLRVYFEYMSVGRGYRALIPYSHKVYSTYMLAIIRDLLDQVFDFEMYADKEAFLAQFNPSSYPSGDPRKERCEEYERVKKHDVTIMDENGYGLSPDNIRFADVYPIYHNLNIGSRLLKRKIAYLTEMLSPADAMRHREHINVRNS